METALETLIEKKFYLEFRLKEDWKGFPEIKTSLSKKIKEVEEAINILELIVKIKNK